MISRHTQQFAATLLAGAATGALFMLVNFGSTPQRPLMLLERVVIVGKSTPMQQQQVAQQQVQQLPRVLVEGQRPSSDAPDRPALVATAKAVCAAPLLC
jgi:hypothetical protein